MSKLILEEQAAPDTPAANKVVLYPKAGGGLYKKDDAGNETALGGGMSDLVEDTTPQLGGDLDLNGNNIDFPTTANVSDCLDEDDMSTDSVTALATQQSIKAYVDNNVYTDAQAIIWAIVFGG